MVNNTSDSGWLTVRSVRLEILERGQGRPILWLHGEEGLDPGAPFLELLAVQGRVLAAGTDLVPCVPPANGRGTHFAYLLVRTDVAK